MPAKGGPQEITEQGKKAAVVICMREYQRLTARKVVEWIEACDEDSIFLRVLTFWGDLEGDHQVER